MKKTVTPLNPHPDSLSPEEEEPSDNKLLYFYFNEDMDASKTESIPERSAQISPFPLNIHGRSKLQEMVTFYENLDIILDGASLDRQVRPGLAVDKKNETTADPLQAVIDLIILAVKPEMIYRVNYPVTTSGDINQFTDLLIIIPDTCQRPFSKIEPLLEVAGLQHQELFCTLVKSEKLHQILGKGDFYFSLACTAENLVYACCEAEELPVLNDEKINHLKTQAKKCFYSHLSRAEKFLNAAKSIRGDAGDGIFLFMLHQATELTLRGIILAFSGMDKRTHELRILLKHAHRFCPGISKILPIHTDEEKYLLQKFDEAYLKSRYQPEYVPECHLEPLLYPKVEQIQQIARDSFEITIDHL